MPGSWDPNSVYTIDVQYDRNTGKQTGSRWKKFGEHALHYAPLLSLRKPVCLSVHPSRSLPLCLYKCMYDFLRSLSLSACLCFLLYLSQSSNLSIIFSVVLTYFPKSFSSLPIPSHTTPPLPCYHTNINEIQINAMTQQGERGDVGEKKR